MKLASWTRDTIARRFAVAVVSAVTFTVVLISAFLVLADVWGRAPFDTSSLPKEAIDISRIIQAAPAAVRPSLAVAARRGPIWVDWYAQSTPVAGRLDAAPRHDASRFVRQVLAASRAASASLGQAREIDGLTGAAPLLRGTDPVLAVQFQDRSWLVFTAMPRGWRLSRQAVWGVSLLFLAISIPLHSLRAARRLSRPVEQLAEAARSFGAAPQMSPLKEEGPEEIKQVISTFNEMQAQIRRFVAHRTLMLAAISHDLRAPLTRIRLRGEFIEDEDQQARLFRDVDEMQQMIDGALAFFKDDVEGEDTTSFDLAGMLCTIVNDYMDQGVRVQYMGPDRCNYRGRPFALKRAVTNLVENAVKYATSPTIELRFVHGAEILVTDQGPGIPRDALECVFSPYYRVDTSRNRQTGGVGLGLTAAESIIQAHGGAVHLSNRPAGGLEAKIVLPPQG